VSEDTTFTRRVCAVLLADVTGFSKLMGENDERTAHAVDHLQSIAQATVGEHKGRAEPVAGDALFATFDSVVAAVQAAVALQRRIAEEPFEGQQLQIRIGVHLGDVLLRDGRAFGDAINIAARLEALARPGGAVGALALLAGAGVFAWRHRQSPPPGAQLVFESREAEARRVAEFFAAVGLPIHLGQLSLGADDGRQLRAVMETALTLPFVGNEPLPVTVDGLLAASGRADALGRQVAQATGEAAYRALHG
jgi:class 3 adenylate cyclase